MKLSYLQKYEITTLIKNSLNHNTYIKALANIFENSMQRENVVQAYLNEGILR